MQKLILKEFMTDRECESWFMGKFLTGSEYDTLIDRDTDAYSTNGDLLLRFRKSAIPYDILKIGYEGLKYGIRLTEARGVAAGESFKRIRTDGSKTNTTVNNR